MGVNFIFTTREKRTTINVYIEASLLLPVIICYDFPAKQRKFIFYIKQTKKHSVFQPNVKITFKNMRNR